MPLLFSSIWMFFSTTPAPPAFPASFCPIAFNSLTCFVEVLLYIYHLSLACKSIGCILRPRGVAGVQQVLSLRADLGSSACLLQRGLTLRRLSVSKESIGPSFSSHTHTHTHTHTGGKDRGQCGLAQVYLLSLPLRRTLGLVWPGLPWWRS